MADPGGSAQTKWTHDQDPSGGVGGQIPLWLRISGVFFGRLFAVATNPAKCEEKMLGTIG
ncbi:MAG: hypothetical protein QOJ29_90 [Thermoleophilaceae bacterium]|nr:hypothetical protein [Thermoleophilaceae bacterium]